MKRKNEYGDQKVKDMARAMPDESIDIIKMMKITGLSEEKLVYRKNMTHCLT